MPVESVTTPKRIQLVYQNLAKNAKEKMNKKASTGKLLAQFPVIIEDSTYTC